MDFDKFMAPAMATFASDAAHSAARNRNAVDVITLGMSQGFALDSRLLTGALAGSILRGDNASEIAGLNAAVRAPTTLDHPNAVAGK